ncbi:hypothetical protein FFLO_00466 [Filobasidium floriforme]|uniref:RNA-polymerase II-associated protein 3-like C-terminal domain-containing protein n=1 Tax=Filobasidium floriforme TaxID=5210 RepID=A0A8K0JRZ7_9TREE|nr:uncharacterized protein HD553DRAFT_318914 [Filobasidium floriforme]KAG7575302.1 hypothetical protein FFLO_00466 [Filobasidium floriforme]KAH8078905.1 hypothetical protein HD553DRAFT_318914 [Filobasidium floriforme]
MNPQRDPKAAATAREAGNASYKKGKWAEAIGHYAQAARLDPTDPAPLLNRAQAYLKLEKWQDVVRDCNTVLNLPLQSKNIKALFRRSLARRELGDEEQDGAVQDLEMILKLEPSNSAAKEELASLRKEIEKNKKKKKDRSNPTVAKKTSTERLTGQADEELKPAVPPLSLAASSTRRIPSTSTTTTSNSSSITNTGPPDPPKGVQIPIKVVPFFSPRTSLAEKPKDGDMPVAGPSRSKTNEYTYDPKQPASTSGFAEKKAGREGKRSFAGTSVGFTGENEAETRSQKVDGKRELVREDRSRRSEVTPPVSGLDMIDRVMHAATDRERWDILTSIPTTKACVWLDPLIEPDHLATIYQAMLSAVSAKGSTKAEADDIEQIKQLVQGLRGMKRWKMVQGLLSKKEKEVIRDLSARCGLD